MSDDPTRWFRRFLLGMAAAVYVAIPPELLMVDHLEEWRQWIPFGVAALGLAAIGWMAMAPSRNAVRAIRATAVVAVVASLAGGWLHLVGNLEIEREVNASAGAAAQVWGALSGASPLLAPGMVALAGVLAAAATYRHPAAA